MNERKRKTVQIIEGGGMNLESVKEHLNRKTSELRTVSKKFGKVSLLIDATNKDFADLQARRYWSKTIRKLPEEIPYHKMAFVVLSDDSNTAKSFTADKPWFGSFTSFEEARQWLTQNN